MLVAEVDGFAFPADATAFENDRRRDLALTSTGLRVVRITWQQLVNESEIVLVRLAQALVRR
jgi:very-short-patch-repair endonuclease